MPELGILGLGLDFSRNGHGDPVDDGARGTDQPRRRHNHHHHHHHRHHHYRRRRRGGGRAKGGAFDAEEEEGRKVAEDEQGCRADDKEESVISFSNNNSTTAKSSSSNNCSSSSSSPFFFISSGGSLFSTPASAPASADPCSFGSDHDPHNSFHLAGRGRGGGGGPDLGPERRASFDINAANGSKEADQEVSREEQEAEAEAGEGVVLDPAKHSFSLALIECQNRRFRSEGHPFWTAARKQRRRRPASLDINDPMSDASISSPRSLVAGGGIKKSSAASAHSRSGMFPCPGTPNYRNGNSGAAGYQKGWSSERVALPANSGRRYGNSAALLPFGNGRAMPSKWEDAEKWICSPVSTDGVGNKSSVLPPHHRRPKSKSGPLGPPGIGGAYMSSSPLLPGFDVGRTRNFAASSPFMAGVLVADHSCGGGGSNGRGGGSTGSGGGENRSYSAQSDNCILRSASVHGWSELLMESSSSLQSSQDEKLGSMKNGASILPEPVLRKDMATQMSPEGSTHSSPKGRPESSSPPPLHTIGELHSHFSRLEVRDVQVDDRVTVTRWSKKHIARGLDKNSSNIIQWRKKNVEARSAAWEVAETAKCMSKMKREEARITAWENLQKAKAEAAIRQMEMKLEKKRSSSMDKILNKLRSAQRKAEEMRNAMTAGQAQQVASTRKTKLFRRNGQMGYLSGCFTCHAF